MSELSPYLKALFANHMQVRNVGQEYVRRDDIVESISELIVQSVEGYNISDLFDKKEEAEILFKEFIASKSIVEENQQFAGMYYRFSNANLASYVKKILENDGIISTAKRIGGRFYSDVFSGYRSQLQPLPDKNDRMAGSYSASDLANVSWPEVSDKLHGRDLAEIRQKAASLISAIEQSDLDERVKANALARAEAVIDLLDAPDPPWKIVAELLNNSYFTAFLNAAAILQLIIGAL